VNDTNRTFFLSTPIFRVLLFFALSTALLLTPAVQASEPPHLEGTEWIDSYVLGANETNATRVLMVGDSITAGYFSSVINRLPKNVKAAKFATSLYMGNPDFFAELTILLKRYKFALIHINNGLHGWDYSEEDYSRRLPLLISFLKSLQPNAKIIWALTTPVRDQNTTARVIERNRAAAEGMRKLGIPVDDLFSIVKDHPEYYNEDGVHFNGKGCAALGAQVASAIQEQLKQ
jgi:hypothetical protein